MVPTPIGLGLALCDRVMIEEGTRQLSLIGTFHRFHEPAFPFVPPPFYVYATLTGTEGDATVELTVTSLETEDAVYSFGRPVRFPDRFSEVRVRLRLTSIEFLEAGTYLFTLLVDGESIAHRRVRVYSTKDES